MLLSEEFTEEDGALMPGAPGTATFGLGAYASDGKFYKIWPSMPPENVDDAVTLSVESGDDVEELGRFKTFDEAKAAAEHHHADT